MQKLIILMVGAAGVLAISVSADHHTPSESAMSAGPPSVSANATIQDWDGNILREGTNGWTCLPDNPGTPGTDPWCADASWMNFLDAMMNGEEPSYTEVGIAYMLMGDTPVSNADPFATEFTNDEDWVTDIGAHLMMLVPGADSLIGISHDPKNGGPWVMWPGTPYQHIMVPLKMASD